MSERLRETGWVESLRPSPAPPPTRCADATVASALAVLGDGPTQWALEVGHHIGLRAATDFSALAGCEAPMIGLQQAVALDFLHCVAGGAATPPLRTEYRVMVRECVRRRLTLAEVWEMIRSGQVWWSDVVLGAVEHQASSGAALRHLHAANQALLVFMNGLMEVVKQAYDEEVEAWTREPEAARGDVALALLDERIDAGEATARLGYEIGQRHHIAAVAWATGATVDRSTLDRAARRHLRGIGARDVLIVPHTGGLVWAWGNRPMAFEAPAGAPAGGLGTSVRLALGEPGEGAAGLRESHRQAVATHALLQRAPGLADASVSHRDVAALLLVLREPGEADAFARSVLGDLAGSGQQHAVLRETARDYLRTRSPQRTAENLFVTRTSVNRRLHRVEALLGRPLADDPTTVALAFEIAHARGW